MTGMLEDIAERLAALDLEAISVELKRDLLCEVSSGSRFMHEYVRRRRIGGDPDADPDADPELRADAEDFLNDLVVELVDTEVGELPYDLEFEDGRIVVYRALTVPRDWVDGDMYRRHLGVCWAFEPEAAFPHEGYTNDGHIEVVMRGYVDFHDVDWPETIRLNAGDEYTVGEEREIRLREDGFVDVVRIDRRVREHGELELLRDFSIAPQRIIAGEPLQLPLPLIGMHHAF